MKNINIPEPCSENWNEMSATEKGSFCQKCAIDVYDFTNKTGDEIRDILTLNIGGRVCGKIEPKQLEELNDDFMAWKMTNKQSFNRAWIFSLLVVFGMTLFSCEENEVPVVREIQKTAQAFLSEIPDLVENARSNSIEVGESDAAEDQIKKGKFHVTAPVEILPEPPEIHELLGEMVMIDESPEPILIEDLPVTEVRVEHMLGGMSWSSAYAEALVEPIDPFASEVKMSGLVYPNPASNQTTLKVSMPEIGDVEIQLFSMSGQQIRTIHSGRIPQGDSEYPMDLTDLETGSYLVVIYSDGKKETVKFSKI